MYTLENKTIKTRVTVFSGNAHFVFECNKTDRRLGRSKIIDKRGETIVQNSKIHVQVRFYSFFKLNIGPTELLLVAKDEIIRKRRESDRYSYGYDFEKENKDDFSILLYIFRSLWPRPSLYGWL